MTGDPIPQARVTAVAAAVVALLLIAGLLMWRKWGLPVWLDAIMAFCF